MKIFSNRTVLEIVALLLLLHCSFSKFIKRGKSHRAETHNFNLKRIYNRGERQLAGESDEKQSVDMTAFKMAMTELLKKEIGARYGADNVKGETDMLVIKKQNGEGVLFKVAVEQMDDEILEIPMVEVTLMLEVITYTFSLEKTPLRGAPEKKCQLIMNNFFYLVDQYISEIGDLKADLGATLALVLPHPPKRNDRMLVDVPNKRASLIKSLPIQSHIKMFSLNLKAKRYISKDKEIRKNIENVFDKISKKRASAQPRQLKGRDDLPPELPASDPKYLTPKKKLFSQGKLSSDLFMDFVITDGVNGGEEDLPNELNFKMSPSEGELGEIKCTCKKLKIGILAYCSHPAMSWTFYISFPTKRFALLHLESMLEDMARDFKLIHKLNDLQFWKDTGGDHMSKQRVVQELIQPVYLYYLFRQEFDNRTQGLTETYNGFDGDFIQYMHTDFLEGDTWWMKLYDVKSKPRREMLFNNITFNEYGEGFLVCYYEATSYIRDKSLKMGLRQIPDESMFNQHMLAVKYIDMMSEFVTRMMHLPVPDDYILPFPIQNLIYPNKDAIPEMERQITQYFGPKTTHDLINSPPVANYDDSIKYVSEICPLLGIEYDDEVVSKMSLGKGPGYELRLGSRSRMRWRVDYCTYPMALTGGEGERRLQQEEEVEGFLV